MASEDHLEHQLQDLQQKLSMKQCFVEAVSSIESLIRENYAHASPKVEQSIFSAISRVATVLKTRYTAPGFWRAGLGLFELAETFVEDPWQKEQLKGYISSANEVLDGFDNQPDEVLTAREQPNTGYLIEGHLSDDSESPQSDSFVRSYLLATASALFAAGSSHREVAASMSETAAVFQGLVWTTESILAEDSDDDMPPRAPPASKEVVENLPVVVLEEETLEKLGPEAECAICKENFVAGDKALVLPCKHAFHPSCLKTWLDEHNSCPICRYELPTDDNAYESGKEREEEADE